MLDSAKLQEEDARFKQKRHEKEGRKGPHPVVPLYTVEDVEVTVPFFSPVEYYKSVKIGDGMEARFCEAGHVLGSSIIKVSVGQNGQQRSVLFSGDIGRPGRPILRDPTLVEQADYILIEFTYGKQGDAG